MSQVRFGSVIPVRVTLNHKEPPYSLYVVGRAKPIDKTEDVHQDSMERLADMLSTGRDSRGNASTATSPEKAKGFIQLFKAKVEDYAGPKGPVRKTLFRLASFSRPLLNKAGLAKVGQALPSERSAGVLNAGERGFYMLTGKDLNEYEAREDAIMGKYKETLKWMPVPIPQEDVAKMDALKADMTARAAKDKAVSLSLSLEANDPEHRYYYGSFTFDQVTIDPPN